MDDDEGNSNHKGNRGWAPGAGRFPLWRRWDARDWQIAGLLGFLFAVQLLGAMLAPAVIFWEDRFGYRIPLAMSGAISAPSALLALWAVFGPQRVAVRLPLTLWLVAAFAECFEYGAVLERGPNGVGSPVGGLALLMTFAAMQLLLWPLRVLGRWRLEGGATAGGSAMEPTCQFTVRALLGWTLATALLVSGWRWFLPDASFQLDILPDLLKYTCVETAFGTLTGWLVVALTWVVLADGKRALFRASLCVLTAVGFVVGLAGGSWAFPEWGGSYQCPADSETGTLLNASLCLAVLWACGYRLTRGNSSGAAVSAERKPLGGPRIAVALAGLLTISFGIAWYLPAIRGHWRQIAISDDWEDRGMWAFDFDDEGEVTELRGDLTSDDAALTDDSLRRIAQLANLQTLDFNCLPIDDRQLALLAPLAHRRLRALFLGRTNITDAGLEILGRLERLENLNLAYTEITDDGLVRLQRLATLRKLDLEGSLVTARGVARLRTALPNCKMIR